MDDLQIRPWSSQSPGMVDKSRPMGKHEGIQLMGESANSMEIPCVMMGSLQCAYYNPYINLAVKLTQGNNIEISWVVQAFLLIPDPKSGHNHSLIQLTVNWWFGSRWFGIFFGVALSNNPFHKGILGIQTTNPNHQFTFR